MYIDIYWVNIIHSQSMCQVVLSLKGWAKFKELEHLYTFLSLYTQV